MFDTSRLKFQKVWNISEMSRASLSNRTIRNNMNSPVRPNRLVYIHASPPFGVAAGLTSPLIPSTHSSNHQILEGSAAKAVACKFVKTASVRRKKTNFGRQKKGPALNFEMHSESYLTHNYAHVYIVFKRYATSWKSERCLLWYLYDTAQRSSVRDLSAYFCDK